MPSTGFFLLSSSASAWILFLLAKSREGFSGVTIFPALGYPDPSSSFRGQVPAHCQTICSSSSQSLWRLSQPHRFWLTFLKFQTRAGFNSISSKAASPKLSWGFCGCPTTNRLCLWLVLTWSSSSALNKGRLPRCSIPDWSSSWAAPLTCFSLTSFNSVILKPAIWLSFTRMGRSFCWRPRSSSCPGTTRSSSLKSRSRLPCAQPAFSVWGFGQIASV